MTHAVTFPSGEEVFWKTLHANFSDNDWRIRFDAVERVYVLAHMAKTSAVKANKVVQTALAAAFYHLVSSVHDTSAAVAQRALIAVRALPSSVLKLIVFCLESQFDSCILDRPLLINAIQVFLCSKRSL